MDGRRQLPTFASADLEKFYWRLRDELQFNVQSIDIFGTEDGGKKLKFLSPKWSLSEPFFLEEANSLLIDCGRSNLIVIDVDNKGSGLSDWKAIEELTGGPFQTFTVRSRSGGMHIYFTNVNLQESALNVSRSKMFELEGNKLEIDIRAKGGCLIAPGSSYRAADGTVREYSISVDAEITAMPSILSSYLLSLLYNKEKKTVAPRTRSLPSIVHAHVPEQVDLEQVLFAQKLITKIINGNTEVHEKFRENYEKFIRIVFATAKICDFNEIILPLIIGLSKSSPKARDNVVAWTTQLFHTPENGRERPGIEFLKSVDKEVDEIMMIQDGDLLAFVKQIHSKAELEIGVTGVALFHKLLTETPSAYNLANYICEVYHNVYRYGIDPAQSTTQKPVYTFYHYNGVRYVQQYGLQNFNQMVTYNIIPILEDALKSSLYSQHKSLVDGWLQRLKCSQIMDLALGKAKELMLTDFFYTRRDLPAPAAFYKKLDADPYLVGFNNGIFNLKTFKFLGKSQITPSTCVSYSVGYNYIGDENGEPTAEQKDDVDKIEADIYNKLFTDPEVLSCAKTFVGSILIGGSAITKKLFMMIGEKGNNGKTAFAAWFLKYTLGDYFGVANSTILTEFKDNADACNPTLVNNRKRKLLLMNEGSRKRPLNSETVKLLSGGDDIVFRNLYGQPETEAFMPKILWVSNHIPNVEGSGDAAFQRRLFPIPFDSEFDSSLTEDLPEEKRFIALSEHDLKHNFKRAASLHLLLILRYTKFFIQNGHRLIAPPANCSVVEQISENTLDFRVNDFVRNHYSVTDPKYIKAKTDEDKEMNKKRCMPVSQLLIHYHQATSPPGTRCDISTNAFIAAITKISGVQVNKVDNTYISTRHAVNLKQTHFAAEIRAKKDEEEEGN